MPPPQGRTRKSALTAWPAALMHYWKFRPFGMTLPALTRQCLRHFRRPAGAQTMPPRSCRGRGPAASPRRTPAGTADRMAFLLPSSADSQGVRSSILLGDDMDDTRFRLQPAGHPDELRAHHDRPGTARNCAAQTMMLATPFSSSRVRKMALPLPGRCRTRTRPATETRLPPRTVASRAFGVTPRAIEPLAQEGDRMRLQRQAERAVVVDDMLAERHRRAAASPARCRAGGCPGRSNSGSCFGGAPARRARAPPRARRAGRGRSSGRHRPRASRSISPTSRPERSQRSRTECVAVAAALRRSCSMRFSDRPLICRKPSRTACARLDDAAHLAMAVVDARRLEGRRLQRAVPAGMVDVDRAHLDAMLARVAHELRRRIEAHRLRVEDRGAEDVGIEGT